MARGEEIHWYSRSVIESCGGADNIRTKYDTGEFAWFASDDSTLYGEAFMSEAVVRSWIAELRLPLDLIAYDISELGQDAIVLRKAAR